MIDLEDIITSWKVSFGIRKHSKVHGTEYYAIDKSQRKDFLKDIVQTLKNKGIEKEYFKMFSVKKTIADACFSPVVYDKKARDGGIQVVFRELNEVVAEFWPEHLDKAPETIRKDVADEVADAGLHEQPFKELDRSVLNEADSPVVSIDKEAAKLLGFDDE